MANPKINGCGTRFYAPGPKRGMWCGRRGVVLMCHDGKTGLFCRQHANAWAHGEWKVLGTDDGKPVKLVTRQRTEHGWQRVTRLVSGVGKVMAIGREDVR